jgi:hypothetical protein
MGEPLEREFEESWRADEAARGCGLAGKTGRNSCDKPRSLGHFQFLKGKARRAEIWSVRPPSARAVRPNASETNTKREIFPDRSRRAANCGDAKAIKPFVTCSER